MKKFATIVLAIICFIGGFAAAHIELPVSSYIEPYAVPAYILDCNECFVLVDVNGREFKYNQEDYGNPFRLEEGKVYTLHVANDTVVGVN